MAEAGLERRIPAQLAIAYAPPPPPPGAPRVPNRWQPDKAVSVTDLLNIALTELAELKSNQESVQVRIAELEAQNLAMALKVKTLEVCRAPSPAHDVVTYQDCSQMPVEIPRPITPPGPVSPPFTDDDYEREEGKTVPVAELSDRGIDSDWMIRGPIDLPEVQDTQSE